METTPYEYLQGQGDLITILQYFPPYFTLLGQVTCTHHVFGKCFIPLKNPLEFGSDFLQTIPNRQNWRCLRQVAIAHQRQLPPRKSASKTWHCSQPKRDDEQNTCSALCYPYWCVCKQHIHIPHPKKTPCELWMSFMSMQNQSPKHKSVFPTTNLIKDTLGSKYQSTQNQTYVFSLEMLGSIYFHWRLGTEVHLKISPWAKRLAAQSAWRHLVNGESNCHWVTNKIYDIYTSRG